MSRTSPPLTPNTPPLASLPPVPASPLLPQTPGSAAKPTPFLGPSRLSDCLNGILAEIDEWRTDLEASFAHACVDYAFSDPVPVRQTRSMRSRWTLRFHIRVVWNEVDNLDERTKHGLYTWDGSNADEFALESIVETFIGELSMWVYEKDKLYRTLQNIITSARSQRSRREDELEPITGVGGDSPSKDRFDHWREAIVQAGGWPNPFVEMRQ